MNEKLLREKAVEECLKENHPLTTLPGEAEKRVQAVLDYIAAGLPKPVPLAPPEPAPPPGVVQPSVPPKA